MITALNIANNFLERAFAENISISPMKMQKLIYILYKEYLRRTGRALFSERFEAWQYGPVLPNVYSEFKGYKSGAIKNFALDADNSITKVKMVPGSDFFNVFNEVWHEYAGYSGVELSRFTHQEHGAWERAINDNTFILKDENIREEESYV
ncbi:DUF4065 domain-containing protein [Leptotrichia sp. OH3620_COT-345]|uniref:Panacea domain-containing protein n=1 Tax=Leptotrichia sp. OH3620_COT-345 TaxID=2491048 RepID=UPI000F6455B1|nr:type II toxin-antitoxin system antitoxin SocA domain-containing protein [Leptotrichia sp. OH3620_COT-345]RRD38452.1 DUF4065 domain-containing protein [Leptotrichia sp. OH3620_COT-345]